MRICYFTHRGKVRENNEDGLLIGKEVFTNTSFDKIQCIENFRNKLLCVADGIGGYEGGEIATKIVLDTLSKLQPESRDELISSLKEAAKNLSNIVNKKPDLAGMGCTLAGLMVSDNKIIIFNVGDCRVYRVFWDKAIRLSRDHSVVENLVLQGVISREEAIIHPQRNVVTSAIMASSNFEVYIREVELFENDRFLICSDGLWEEREDFSKLFENPEDFLNQLFINNRLKDNFSFITVEVG